MPAATVPISPLWPVKTTVMRLKSGKAIISEIGREKKCSRCNEYWPADSVFFFTQQKTKDGLNDWCKACYSDWKQGLPPFKEDQGSLSIFLKENISNVQSYI